MKHLRKSGKISVVVHKKAMSKQQIQKLFESGELVLRTPKTCTTTKNGMVLSWSFLRETGKREPPRDDSSRRKIFQAQQPIPQCSTSDEKPTRRPVQCRGRVTRKDIFRTRSSQMSCENNQELLVTLKSNTRCSFLAGTGGEKF